MKTKIGGFRQKNQATRGEHAESAIGVSNSLKGFRGFAEFMLKVYLSMDSKIAGFPKENQAFR